MNIKKNIQAYPVLSYVLLCYLITWVIWFSGPLFAGGHWHLLKIYLGIGLGPGLAAIILDDGRGTAGKFGSRRWWTLFTMLFLPVLGINISILITGDAIHFEDFEKSIPPVLSVRGILISIGSALVLGFVFASAGTSYSTSLRSILKWRVSWRWWFFALLFPAVVSGLGLAGDLVIGEKIYPIEGISSAPGSWLGYSTRSFLFSLLIVGIGEETGWRGFMLPELQKKFSPLVSALIVGVVWGLWHFPLFVIGAYPGEPIDVVSYVFIGPLFSIILTWLYNKTAGNLLLVIVLHGAINSTRHFLPDSMFMPVFMVLAVAGFVISGKMWKKKSASTAGVISEVGVAGMPKYQ